MNAVPRIPAPARRALEAAGLFTLEDCVQAGRSSIAQLHGMGPKVLRVLDEAVVRAGLCDREGAEA